MRRTSTPVPAHLICSRFASLLANTATLLGGSLQVWSDQLQAILSTPDPPPTGAVTTIREVVSRVAAHHDAVRGRAPDGTTIVAVPIRTREGLAAMISVALPARPKETAAEPASSEPDTAQRVVAFLADQAHALGQYLDLARESADKGVALADNRTEFLLSTVKALVSTIEAKDSYTSGHSARVHLLSMLLGKELGMAGHELESLKWASILHDVGKIGMPESILKKPDRLTLEEYETVKQHPQRGYQVLNHIRQLQDASQAVLLHHERYAGGGYPLGIAGEGIPRAARVIAVADTFDALTTTRPYRAPLTEDEAFDEIRRASGRQLDPEIVDALERMLPFLRENLVMIEATSQAA